jgi:hypothetical protein
MRLARQTAQPKCRTADFVMQHVGNYPTRGDSILPRRYRPDGVSLDPSYTAPQTPIPAVPTMLPRKRSREMLAKVITATNRGGQPSHEPRARYVYAWRRCCPKAQRHKCHVFCTMRSRVVQEHVYASVISVKENWGKTAYHGGNYW